MGGVPGKAFLDPLGNWIGEAVGEADQLGANLAYDWVSGYATRIFKLNLVELQPLRR